VNRLPPLLAVLAGLCLVTSLLASWHPELVDLRAPALVWGGLLLALAGAARKVRLEEFPGGPVGALLALSLLCSLGLLAAGSVDFLRQVRSQAGMGPDQKRAAYLAYQVGLRWDDIEQARQQIPEDGSVLLLADRASRGYPLLLVAYYLEPRHLYGWRSPSRPGLRPGLPSPAWLRSRGIRWIVRVSGPGPRRIESWAVEP